LNFYFIVRYAGVGVPVISIFVRPFVSAVACAVSAVAFYSLIGNLVGYSRILTLASIVFAAVIYGVTLLLLGGITKEDIRLIPKAEKLLKIPILNKLVREK
jgi:stage V sporulation protein B